MSLLRSKMEECVYLEKKIVPDGYGGQKATYTDGASFQAAIILSQSLETLTAEAQGVKGIYTVYVDKNINIDYHEAFKRVSDGKTFRSVSKDETTTPNTSRLDLRVFRAEEWIPS